jgi:RNA polymerase sigma-70 factor (ECF subfamily)
MTLVGQAQSVRDAIDLAHRNEWSRVLATTVRVTRDIDLAEECVEDAYLSALTAWERDGIPANPGAWLTTAARRRALDLARRASSLRKRYPLIIDPDGGDDPAMTPFDEIPDERLRLIFTCCHPALAQDSQVPLTLRLVCGLKPGEIARLFLVPQATVVARITRAKAKIQTAGIPYRIPEMHELPDRLDAVLNVIYLIYTAGHVSADGDQLTNDVLTDRAMELARILLALMPDEREVRGLIALLLFSEARRPARTDAAGDLVLLEDQDRSLWNAKLIDTADRILRDAIRGVKPGRYVLQAAIAGIHTTAPSWAETDWHELLVLYDALLEIWPSPVVELNRIAVQAMAESPTDALRSLGGIENDPRLSDYHYLPTLRADLLCRLGRFKAAADAYRTARTQTANSMERRFLDRRISEMIVASHELCDK